MTSSFDLLWRLLNDAQDSHPKARAARHRPPVQELQRLTPKLGREINPSAALDVVRSLCAETERLHPILREKGVTVPEEMPGEMVTLGALVEAVVLRGRPYASS